MPVEQADIAELVVLERLRLCAGEIFTDYNSLGRAFAQPPSEVIGEDDYPICYGLVGASADTDTENRGRVTVARNYVQRLLVMPVTQGIDDVEDGAEANVRAIPYIAAWRRYFMSRPRLSTDTLPPLAGIGEDVVLRDSGLVARKAPGGAICGAIDYTFTIVMSEKIQRVSIPSYE